MTNLDRFSQGLPDPQEAKVVGYCDNKSCGGDVYEGQEVIKAASEGVYCNMKCFAESMGAVSVSWDEL